MAPIYNPEHSEYSESEGYCIECKSFEMLLFFVVFVCASYFSILQALKCYHKISPFNPCRVCAMRGGRNSPQPTTYTAEIVAKGRSVDTRPNRNESYQSVRYFQPICIVALLSSLPSSRSRKLHRTKARFHVNNSRQIDCTHIRISSVPFTVGRVCSMCHNMCVVPYCGADIYIAGRNIVGIFVALHVLSGDYR